MSAEDDGEPARPRPRTGIGRRIILAAWAILTLWITAVAFASVVPQIFAPEASVPPTLTTTDCDEAHRILFAHLIDHAAEAMRITSGDASRHQADAAFFAQWDANFLGLRCDGAVHERLHQLRYRYDNYLRRYRREEGRHAGLLDELLSTGTATFRR